MDRRAQERATGVGESALPQQREAHLYAGLRKVGIPEQYRSKTVEPERSRVGERPLPDSPMVSKGSDHGRLSSANSSRSALHWIAGIVRTGSRNQRETTMLGEKLGELQGKVTLPKILRGYASMLCSALVLSPIVGVQAAELQVLAGAPLRRQ